MNAKPVTFKLITAVILTTIATGCNIVDVNPDEGDDPMMGNETVEVLNTGTEQVPDDSTTIVSLLHNGSSKVWAAEEFTIEGLSSFLRCRLDDEIEIFSDGTYIYNGGDILCGAEDNQTIREGTWEVDVDRKRLIFDRGTEMEAAGELVTLEEDEIVLSGQYSSDLFGTFDIAGRYLNN